jgi:hypothetical protein
MAERTERTERDPIFGDLVTMWEVQDPMPPGLVDKVLVAVATENLDAEYELLHLVERSRELEGARGAVGEALTITFAGGAFSLLLRVTSLGDTFCRVDGWVTPQSPMTLKVSQPTGTVHALVDALGRFEIPRLPTGLTRFFLLADDTADTSDASGSADGADGSFATPTVEL